MNFYELLRKLPEWNELLKLPKKIEELEKRVEELETPSLNLEVCPSCKAKTFKLISSKPHPIMGDVGVLERHYKCNSCDFEETQTYSS